MSCELDIRVFCPVCRDAVRVTKAHLASVSDEVWVMFRCCNDTQSGWAPGEKAGRYTLFVDEFDPRGLTRDEFQRIRMARWAAVNAEAEQRMDWVVSFRVFCEAQREIPSQRLSANQKEAASAEWSRQLRAKVAESERRERHQLVCDLRDEP